MQVSIAQLHVKNLKVQTIRTIKRRESAVAIHHWAHTWHRPNMDGYGKLYSIDDICNDKAVADKNK